MFPSSYFAPTYFAPKYYPPITTVIINIIKKVFCLTGEEASSSIDAAQESVSLVQAQTSYSSIAELFDYTLQGIKAIYTLEGIEQAVSILGESLEPISLVLQSSSYDIVGSEVSNSGVGVKDSFNVTAQEEGNVIVSTIKIVC